MNKPARVVHTPGESPEPPADAQRDAEIAQADAAAMSEKLASNQPAPLRAADVDPTKIKRAVLTVDGWVCPAVSPGFAGG
jgi:hypothetical protein